MDDEQFQELIARLKNASSRRDAVKGLIGGALVSVGIIADPPAQTRAQNRCKKNGKNCVESQNLQYGVTRETVGRRRRRRD